MLFFNFILTRKERVTICYQCSLTITVSVYTPRAPSRDSLPANEGLTTSCRLITYWPARSICISGAGISKKFETRIARQTTSDNISVSFEPLDRLSHVELRPKYVSYFICISRSSGAFCLRLTGQRLAINRRFAFLAKQVEAGGTRQRQ